MFTTLYLFFLLPRSFFYFLEDCEGNLSYTSAMLNAAKKLGCVKVNCVATFSGRFVFFVAVVLDSGVGTISSG